MPAAAIDKMDAIKMNAIPLHRMDSSGGYTPSEYSTVIVASSTATLLPSSTSFNPTAFLQIQSNGKGPISFPLPSSELTIPIFSLTTSRPVYLSIRPTRRSGSCRLVSAEDETETSIATTTYWFGPNRSPQVKIGRDDDVDADVFHMVGKSLLTRAVCFESKRWGKFEWRYCGKKERGTVGEKINNVLVLEKIVDEKRIRVAQLIRSEETRTPGTKSSYAGNGGRLEMCVGGEEGLLVDEVTVVATCLVMMKKEIDRLRTVQIMVMSGAAGGGP